MDPSFIHLRVSSEYSISRGLLRINEIVDRAVKLKMPAVALTDLNNMFGMVKFFKSLIKNFQFTDLPATKVMAPLNI